MRVSFGDQLIDLVPRQTQEIGRRHLAPSDARVSRQICFLTLQEDLATVCLKSARDIRFKEKELDLSWRSVKAGEVIWLQTGACVEVVKELLFFRLVSTKEATLHDDVEVVLKSVGAKSPETVKAAFSGSLEKVTTNLSFEMRSTTKVLSDADSLSETTKALSNSISDPSKSKASVAPERSGWLKVTKSFKRDSPAASVVAVPLQAEEPSGKKAKLGEALLARPKMELVNLRHSACSDVGKTKFFVPVQVRISCSSLLDDRYHSYASVIDNKLVVEDQKCEFIEESKVAFWYTTFVFFVWFLQFLMFKKGT
jgi:hypothetical protein